MVLLKHSMIKLAIFSIPIYKHSQVSQLIINLYTNYKWGAPIAQLGEHQTLDHKIEGSIPFRVRCCVLEQGTSSRLLSTG